MLPHRCDMQSADAHALGRPLDSNDSACTSLFPPIAPNEPRDATDAEARFFDELLVDFNPDALASFNPSSSEETRLCKSCKKQKPEADNYDPGRKTCRSCLRSTLARRANRPCSTRSRRASTLSRSVVRESQVSWTASWDSRKVNV